MAHRRSLAAFVAAAFMAAPFAAAQPAPPRAAPRTGVVLLANGQVLHGDVVDEGQQALVTFGPGSQMRLPWAQIVGTGRTLDDLFAAQHRRLSPSDVAGRIELARWCLRSGMTAAAGRVIVELVRLAPDDPRVANLEFQLRRQLEPPVATTSQPSAAAAPPAAELRDVAQQITPRAFEMYVRQIQPLLVNHCSASGCHGVAGKAEFQLLRPLTGAKLTQRMTQRNLHAVLAQVDRQAPLDSPLLVAAIAPHAARDEPLLREQTDRAEREALRAWLLAVGEISAQADERPSTPPAPASVLLQPETHPVAPLPAAAKPSDAASPEGARSKSQRTRREAPSAEEFNRRFFPERFGVTQK